MSLDEEHLYCCAGELFISIFLAFAFSCKDAVAVLIARYVVFTVVTGTVCLTPSTPHVVACSQGKCFLEVGPPAAMVPHCRLRAAGSEHPHVP